MTQDDVLVFFEHRRDPVARQMAAFGGIDPDDFGAFQKKWRDLLETRGFRACTIGVDGVAVGYVGTHLQCGQPSISFWLDRTVWGRGIATAAVMQLATSVKTRPLYARAAHDNAASLRVLAKCGFIRAGTERDFAQARGEDIETVVMVLRAPRQGNAGQREST